jgi:cytochrome c
MEFLEKFVIPQSSEHLQLLHYLAMLIFFLFVPFISMVFGGTFLSLFYRHKGVKENHKNYLTFAKEIIEVVTVSKSLGVILGIVPVLTTVLIYSQLLHLSNTTSVIYLSISFLLIILALIFIYTYRYSTKFTFLFGSLSEAKLKDSSVMNEIAKLGESSKHLSSRSGFYGLILLFFSIWFFTSGVTVAVYPVDWGQGSFLSVLFSWQVLVRFLFFIAMAFAFTGGSVLFRYFYWEGGKKNLDENYKEFVRKNAVNHTLYSLLVLPLLLAIILFSIPGSAVSGVVFGLSILALLLMFLTYNLLYSMIKNANANHTGLLYMTLIAIFMALIIKDQVAVDNAAQEQAVILSSKYDEMMAQLTGSNKPKAISGEEIYKNICSSCHSFDHKVVGPPYQQTMPKYEGKMNELVAFILSPKQNNPGYPPMPNPGLRPDQAQAVAKYIMETYQEKYKKK